MTLLSTDSLVKASGCQRAAVDALCAGGAAGSSTTATMQVQLKPSLLVQADATTSAGGQTFPIDEIMSTKARGSTPSTWCAG
jgi:hypothetical protein